MRTLLVGAVVLWGGACGGREPAPATPIPRADPGADHDPINRGDLPRLRAIASDVLHELVAALPADHRARVGELPLVSDNALGDVNAYATCSDDGTPIIAISDGLLGIAAHLAMSTASDEVFQTDKERDYLDWLEHHGIAPPPVGFYYFRHHTDRAKIARQRELFEEELAFILGHELAHHYLGHLACNPAGGVVEEVGQIAADSVPLFNQTSEIAADVAGTKNLLTAGARRTRYAWTEDGALLVIAAFNRRHPVTLEDVVLGFERSHPFPQIRAPFITSTAELWRGSGGALPL